ncbi:MAG: hypothetical protein KAU10_05570, partial [Dehalococcoidia bacterium]|nr:hypothetical protein [Dehalococcoidia bacterium]
PGILGLGCYHDRGQGQLCVKRRYEIGLGGVEEHCLVLGSGRGQLSRELSAGGRFLEQGKQAGEVHEQ